MLLHGDPRIRGGEFIAEEDLEAIADAAWQQLEDLGFVGLLEDGDEIWAGLGDFFGAELRPGCSNARGHNGTRAGALPLPPLTDAALELLERRTAADAILYGRVAMRRHGGEIGARRSADDAFEVQRQRFVHASGNPREGQIH